MRRFNSCLPATKPLACLLAGLGLAAALPAQAETEIEALKRELAEQKVLIQRLLQAQENQQQVNAKIEAQTAAVAQAQKAAPAAGGLPGVTFYGTADVNVSRTNSGFGAKTGVGSGGMTASSLGVKGLRELGDNWKVIGELEAGLAYDTGAVANGAVTPGVNNASPSSGGLTGTGPQIFSRQAYAGLSHTDLGSLTIGRQYTGSYIIAASLANAMGSGFLGNSATFLPVIGGMPTRVNNSVVYKTPSLSGFSGWLTYTVGSENNVSNNVAASATTTTNDQAGRGWDATVFYRQGPLNAAFSTWSIANASFVTATETDLAQKKGWQAAANYNFGPVKLYGTYVHGTIGGGNYEKSTKALSKSSGYSVSAAVPFGRHTVLLSHSHLSDDSLLNKSANLLGLAYTYEMYANTKLYASWARLRNNANATYSLADGGDLVGNVTAPGFSPSGVVAGLNVNF